MKRYYQPKGDKKGKYALRENVYRRTWYLIADYPYYKKTHGKEGGGTVVRETEFGYRIQGPPLQYLKYIEAIEAAKKEIPEQYIDDIMSHIMEKKRYKDIEGVSEKTLKKWVQKFIWHVAHNLGDV